MSEDVKIVYCKDTNDKIIFYTDVIKGQKYYCLDCGEELIVKDGKLKIKHLSHKSGSNCKATGESYIHQHYKNNLFIPGMAIMVKNDCYEIQKVLTEIELGKYYNKDIGRKVIPDILLVTDGGDIAVEFNYKNKKNWEEYFDVYSKLNLLDVFEIKLSNIINDNKSLQWTSAYDEFDRIKKVKNATSHQMRMNFYVGRCSVPKKVYGKIYELECFSDGTNYASIYNVTSLKRCKLRFVIDNQYITEKRISFQFPQPWIAKFTAIVEPDYYNGCYLVKSFYNPQPFLQTMIKDEDNYFADKQLSLLLHSGYAENVIKVLNQKVNEQ